MRDKKDKVEILIVEDSLTQALRLRHVLEKADYIVRVARDGVQGLESALAEKPSIVITDVVMPEMDGFELCRQIKQDENLKDIPVVLLTSLSDPEDVIKGLHSGADNFLTKPYDEDHLLQRVHHILANKELRKAGGTRLAVEVLFAGRHHKLDADRLQIIDLLLSTFEAAVLQGSHLEKARADYRNALGNIKRVQDNFKTLMDAIQDAILVVDERRQVRYVNPAARTLFNRTVEEFIDKPFFDLPLEEGDRQEVKITRFDGKILTADMRVVKSYWDGQDVHLVTIRDVTENVELRERLLKESITDPLTGLYNRRGFMTFAEKELKLAVRLGFWLVCLFADLDGFKEVNDTLGHEEGDKVLRECAHILKQTFRETDVIGRLGGDEFVVLTIQKTPGTVDELMARLRENLTRHNAGTQRPYALSLSMGAYVMDPQSPCSLDELMTEADRLMYEEKKKKKLETS